MSYSIRNILVLAATVGALSANTITMVDVPGATSTQLTGISNNGVAVGYYSDASGTHGFEVLANGTLVYPFDAPGGALPYTSDGTNTNFQGVNNSGTIVGIEGIGFQQPSFILSGGVYSTFTIPGCGNTYSSQGINGINDNGDVVGGCYVANPVANGFFQISGSPAVLFDAPGALDTVGRGINNLDQVVGYYDTSSGAERYYGFIRNSDGTYTVVGVPGSYSTELSSINDGGTFVGYWDEYGGDIYSFYGNNPASLTSFAVPGATSTYIEGINDSGEVVGYYVDISGVDHGFTSSVGTPEPSSAFLAAAGMLGLALLKRLWR